MKKGLLLLGVWFAVVVMSVSNATAREYTLSDLYQQALENSEKIKYAEENLFIPDYAIEFGVGRVTGNEKRDVLFQSPRNHSLRFMVSDSFRMRRLPSFTI